MTSSPPDDAASAEIGERAGSVAVASSVARTAICTIVARNYMAYALALMASIEPLHPDASRWVLIIDGSDRQPDPEVDQQGIRVAFPTDFLPYEIVMSFAISYDVTEFSTAIKPFLLRYLLDRGHDCVMYVDPDVIVFRSLQSTVLDPLRESSIVLTPHTTDPIPLDGCVPTEVTLLRAGAYNLGFIGVRNTSEARRFLAWWGDRLEILCLNAVEQGLFVDQKWIDLVPGLFPGTRILYHRGLNVAYWNLHARALAESADEPPALESGEPLVFFHFSGFDPLRPDELSRHQDRIEVASTPVLAGLLREYALELGRWNYADRRRIPYAYGTFSNGARVDGTVRALFRQARKQGLVFSEPRDAEAWPSFFDYCNSTDPSDSDGFPRLTRYLAYLHASRPDLQSSFPAPRDENRAAYFAWLRTQTNGSIDGAFLAAAERRTRERRRGDHIVNVAGYFSVESGVGEAGRSHVAAIRSAGIDVHLVDVSANAALSRQGAGILDGVGRAGGVNLICVNADQVLHFVGTAGMQLLPGRYNIGSWWWELPEFPASWRDRFEPFDAIWVGSEYVRSTIQAVSSIPVVRVPPIVAPPPVRDPLKERFGFPADATVFLYFFDYLSEFERKNPLGAIHAFQRAFPIETDVRLVLKAINSRRDPGSAARLRAACRDDPRIEIREAYLTRDEKNAMIAAADCYVSLHRAEGFGLTIAEAMYFRTPVVCTGWSGNVDFTNRSNAFIVDAPLVRLERDYGPYAAGQYWADPDIEHAAIGMREIREKPLDVLARAVRAEEDIRRNYSALAVAALVREALSQVLDLSGAMW